MQRENDAIVTNLSNRFMKWGDPVSPNQSLANISSPPTDAELDSAFATPASLPDPFLAVVNDAGTVWLVVATNGAWYYEALTLAV